MKLGQGILRGRWAQLRAGLASGVAPIPRVYLLRDDFDDTRAAGSVNGTPATPGPGTRTVTDTENKITVANGVLSFAGGKAAPAYGDPGFWLDAVVTQAGLIFFITKNIPAADKTVVFGFDDNQVAGIAREYAAIFHSAGTVVYYENGGAISGAVATYSANTYLCAIVLRHPGSFLFVKGGAFANFTLLYASASGQSLSAMYPSITNYSAAFTADDIRISPRTWLPKPLAYDTFTRANGAIGTSEIVGPDSQAVTARTWTGATWTIATNKAVNTPTLGAEEATGNLVVGTWYAITATEADHFYAGCAIGNTFRATAATALDANNKVQAITLVTMFASCGDLGTPDVLASIDLTITAGTQAGVVVCLDDAAVPANYLHAYHDGTLCKLDKVVGGTATNLISAAATYAASATLRVITYTSGSDLKVRLYWNNVLIGTEQTVSDAGIKSNTIHGMFDTSPTLNTSDNFEVLPRGTEGQHEELSYL